jgi:hypothetical protein
MKDEDYELSSSDLKTVLGSNIKIVEYSQISTMKHITNLFDNQGRCILFCSTISNTVGHYECLFLNGKIVTFFDSYGLKPDAFKKFVNNNLLIRLKEYPDYLTDLFMNAISEGYSVVYNPFDYQSWKGNISTCGDHCSVRLLHKNLNGLQYKQFLSGLMKTYNVDTFDEVVTIVISKIIGK